MSIAPAYRLPPLGLFPAQPAPSPHDRLRRPVSGETLGIMRASRSAQDCGGNSQNGTEVVTRQALARAARRWRFRLRPAAPRLMHVGLIMSSAGVEWSR